MVSTVSPNRYPLETAAALNDKGASLHVMHRLPAVKTRCEDGTIIILLVVNKRILNGLRLIWKMGNLKTPWRKWKRGWQQNFAVNYLLAIYTALLRIGFTGFKTFPAAQRFMDIINESAPQRVTKIKTAPLVNNSIYACFCAGFKCLKIFCWQ